MKKAATRAGTKTSRARAAGGPQDWRPDHAAVSVASDPATGRVALVRHDAYPYQREWTEADGLQGLFAIAADYLSAANTRLGLPRDWLKDLVQPGNPARVQLRWFHGRNDPRDSYVFRRHAGFHERSRTKPSDPHDRTAVLLAGLCYASTEEKDGLYRFYGRQGLRVIAHVSAPKSSGCASVRITGVSSTLPTWPSKSRSMPLLSLLRHQGVDALVEQIRDGLPRAFGLSDESLIVELGIPLPDAMGRAQQPQLVLAKTASRAKSAAQRDSYALVSRLKVGHGIVFEPVHKRPLFACANADAMVFVQDPVSKNGAAHFTRLRPNRSSLVLDPEREKVALGNLPAGAAPGSVQLVDPDPNNDPDFRVTNSMLVDHPLPEANPKEVPAPVDAHVRTSTFAAANAFHHASALFGHMRAYGFPPVEYFRFAARPVDVRYRSGIRPGAGDGRTVNAQVRWNLRPDATGIGAVQVCFALGDLQSAVGRLPNNLPAAPERSPLGVAADPRWCWHEYGHVLLAAATGDLELGFAHSAGDAIAAILCDPDSQLAFDRSGALANAGPWRGITYPWVLIPRRHDRDVQCGWGWTGAMNRRERYFEVPGLSDKRGYWTEQILSSSLFRLYRAIGGDCERTNGGKQGPAVPARRDAANYTVYLIMRSIQSLGAAAVTPCMQPHDFVDAMRKADTGTEAAPGPGGYVGGTVHKVVQWAFERQGLDGVPAPGSAVIGPEETALVDLHIDDLRAKPDGPYTPVDLHSNRWHAHPNALRLQSPPVAGVRNKIHVRVENRGRQKALGARVDVWVALVKATGAIPDYPDAAWQPVGSMTKDVPGAAGPNPGAAKFGPYVWTPPSGNQAYAVFASATCDADRSNVDPATALPCVTLAGPIRCLDACDNNLGLMVVKTA